MFLVDNFKIILLVGLVCTVGIGPSTALKCIQDDGIGGMTPDAECRSLDPVCQAVGGRFGFKCEYKPNIYFCELDGKKVECAKDSVQQLQCCCNMDNCNTGAADGPLFKEFCEYKKVGVEALFPGMECPKTQEEIDEEDRINKEEEAKKRQDEEDKKERDEKNQAAVNTVLGTGGLGTVSVAGATGLFVSFCGVFPLAMLVAVSICSFPLGSFL